MLKRARGVIICLGKALEKTGKPEKMLLQRCEKALEIQKQTNFPIITSGADTVKCGITEAKVMSDFILSKNQKSEIILEEKANNTVENFLFCFEIMERLGANHIILVTSEHHGPRANFVCRAVMSHRHLNFTLDISTSDDLFSGAQELRNSEYEKIFTTIPYLLEHFAIESPGEKFFEEAKSQLENLKFRNTLLPLKMPQTKRRKSICEEKLKFYSEFSPELR